MRAATAAAHLLHRQRHPVAKPARRRHVERVHAAAGHDRRQDVAQVLRVPRLRLLHVDAGQGLEERVEALRECLQEALKLGRRQ